MPVLPNSNYPGILHCANRFGHLRLYWVLRCISLELYLLWQISPSLLWQLLFLTAVHLESESIVLLTAFFNMVITVCSVWKLCGNGNVTLLFDALKCYYIVWVQWKKSLNNCYSTFGLWLRQKLPRSFENLRVPEPDVVPLKCQKHQWPFQIT